MVMMHSTRFIPISQSLSQPGLISVVVGVSCNGTLRVRNSEWGKPRGFQGADAGSAHSPSPLAALSHHNAALNILKKVLGAAGYVGTSVRLRSLSVAEVNASGDLTKSMPIPELTSGRIVTALLTDSDLSMKVES